MKRKITQYLKRAEEIFNCHLQRTLGNGSPNATVRSWGLRNGFPRAHRMPWLDLQGATHTVYAVLSILESNSISKVDWDECEAGRLGMGQKMQQISSPENTDTCRMLSLPF